MHLYRLLGVLLFAEWDGGPAEVVVGGLLVARHEVHELQASALVLRSQQRATVGVDAAHALQCCEEGLPYLLTLCTPRACTCYRCRSEIVAVPVATQGSQAIIWHAFWSIMGAQSD